MKTNDLLGAQTISLQHPLSHLCHTQTPVQSLAFTASLADHTHTHFHQSELNQVCTSTSFRKSAPRITETTFGSFTVVLSHSAGNTAATGANFLHLAISYDISVRSLVPQRNQAAQIVGRNLRGLPHETATWRTRSASNGGTHRVVSRVYMHFFGVFAFRAWVWGSRALENHSFGNKRGGSLFRSVLVRLSGRLWLTTFFENIIPFNSLLQNLKKESSNHQTSRVCEWS